MGTFLENNLFRLFYRLHLVKINNFFTDFLQMLVLRVVISLFNEVSVFPTIAYFRNGDRLMYEGSIENEMAVLRFATDLHNIRIPGRIVEVGVSLLEFFMDERKDVFAFLYEEDDGRAKKILQRLEAIDDNLVSLFEAGNGSDFAKAWSPKVV